MKEMTWREYAERRGNKFELECRALSKIARGGILLDPTACLNPNDAFDFDEWVMPDGCADLSDDEIVEGLAHYVADCITDGEGYRYYDSSDGTYYLPDVN